MSLCCAFIMSRWKEVLAGLSSKLRGGGGGGGGGGGECNSKWPELNFVSFLSMTVEVLRHGRLVLGKHWNQSAEGCHELIGEHLEDLTVTVTERCALPISLKELLKVYNMIIDNSLTLTESETTYLGTTELNTESRTAESDTAESKSRTESESEISKPETAESESKTPESESKTAKEAPGPKSLMKQLEACLPTLFLSTMMTRIVTAVVQDLSKEDAEMCNLSKSIVRRVVLLLMKYASLLEDQSRASFFLFHSIHIHMQFSPGRCNSHL